MTIPKSHYALLCAICASLFTTPLMAAGVNAILPELRYSLSAGATELSLVGTAYSLALAIFQLACGTLGDIWGHKRIFLAGAAIFAVSSAAAGMASSVDLFIALRFVQGTGGAMLSAAGLALLASAAPPAQRATYLGLSGAAVYAGIACGPPVAGSLTGTMGWRSLFWVNSATSVIVFLLMLLAVRHEWRPARNEHFDLPGCLVYALAMLCLTVGAARIGQNLLIGMGAFAIFALLLAFFCKMQLKAPFPLLNLGIMAKNRILSLSCIAAFVNYASFFGIVFYFSFYLQVAQGLDVRMAGFVLAFQPLMQAIAQPVATRLCNEWGPGPVSAAGSLICGAGLLACAFLTPHTPLVVFMMVQALLGWGISMFSLANTAILLESAGQGFIGQASGLTGAMRTGGQLVSMALITLTMSLFLGNEPVSMATMNGFMRSMRIDLVILGVLNICGLGIIATRNKKTQKIN